MTTILLTFSEISVNTITAVKNAKPIDRDLFNLSARLASLPSSMSIRVLPDGTLLISGKGWFKTPPLTFDDIASAWSHHTGQRIALQWPENVVERGCYGLYDVRPAYINVLNWGCSQ
jgi:hypothetical protein